MNCTKFLNVAASLNLAIATMAGGLVAIPAPALAQTQASNSTPCPDNSMVEGHFANASNGTFWTRVRVDCSFTEPSNYNDNMIVTRIAIDGSGWINFSPPSIVHPAMDQRYGMLTGRGCLSKNASGAWTIIPDAATCSLLPTPNTPRQQTIPGPIVQIPTGPIILPELPDCGLGTTAALAKCNGYLIHRLNHYPGNFRNSYSLSILPSNYPTIPRCNNAAPIFNSKASATTGCIRKYIWIKPKSPATINGSPQVTNPPSSVEVLPPN